MNDEEVDETLAIILIVGGSIMIPHLRRALRASDQPKESGPRRLQRYVGGSR